VPVALPEKFATAGRLVRWKLHGPSLSAKTGVQFERVPQSKQTSSVDVDAHAAILLQASTAPR
jgi:hypothetical protein